jgi:quinol monooxygenase YgiN
MAVISILNMHFDPERIDEALTALHTTLIDTRAFSGNLGVDVVQNVKDPAHLQLVERWETIADDDAYRAWRASADAPASLIAPLLVERGPMTVATLLDEV